MRTASGSTANQEVDRAWMRIALQCIGPDWSGVHPFGRKALGPLVSGLGRSHLGRGRGKDANHGCLCIAVHQTRLSVPGPSGP
jgi:hypothetical protein